jgi:ABC-type antimicrobial peptide transport system permease subunit
MEQMGRHYPLTVYKLEDQVDVMLAEERLVAILASFFGGLALLLASIGLYGLMSYTVNRRTSEIGVRMALGAQPGNVTALILRDALWLVLAGIAVGVPIALAASSLVSGMLFGLSGSDPTMIALSATILLGVALFAGYLPARRASRIAPTIALRSE